jgi:2-oxoglutarate dehydrogenase E2 component (dihydrolipoamide succinyltransferase)
LAEVVMPQLGETVTEGTITRWLKSVGDQVARDEPLFEVSTDKVDSEVPSPFAGMLSEILVPEGETAGVGTVLAVIGDKASTPGAAPSASPSPAPAPPPPAPPEAPRAPAPTSGEDGSGAQSLILSPVVRRLLADNRIPAAEVQGSGPGGRITRADVLAEIDSRRSAGAAVPPVEAREAQISPAPLTAQAPTYAGTLASSAGEVVPFTNIRRRTAEHMVRSKATSAHTLVVHEADYENVERVRRAARDRFEVEEGFPLTYLPFVARATVEALREWPRLNASVGEDSLIVHREIGLGIAVDLEFDGLIVPVVHRAEELTLRGIARRVRDLAARARARKLDADDISGGTFSITNAGPFGTFVTYPIINQPQIAILSTDGVKRRPVVVEGPDGGEAIAIHSVGLLSLAWDHRAVDGAYAAAFVRSIARVLAEHDWASEL